jgi:hypothetical protein
VLVPFWEISRDDNTTDIISPAMLHCDFQIMNSLRDKARSHNNTHRCHRSVIAQGGSTNEPKEVLQTMGSHSRKRPMLVCVKNEEDLKEGASR